MSKIARSSIINHLESKIVYCKAQLKVYKDESTKRACAQSRIHLLQEIINEIEFIEEKK